MNHSSDVPSQICPYPNGTKVRCTISGTKIDCATISIQQKGSGYIVSVCQNIIGGGSAAKLFYFEESWDIVNTVDTDSGLPDWDHIFTFGKCVITSIVSRGSTPIPNTSEPKSYCDFKHGDKVKVKFTDSDFVDGTICINVYDEITSILVCQNEKDGTRCSVLFDFNYSWEIFNSSEHDSFQDGLKDNHIEKLNHSAVQLMPIDEPENHIPTLLTHGMKVMVKIRGFADNDNVGPFPYIAGTISISTSPSPRGYKTIHVCQDECDGDTLIDKFGFDYSWLIYDESCGDTSYKESFKKYHIISMIPINDLPTEPVFNINALQSAIDEFKLIAIPGINFDNEAITKVDFEPNPNPCKYPFVNGDKVAVTFEDHIILDKINDSSWVPCTVWYKPVDGHFKIYLCNDATTEGPDHGTQFGYKYTWFVVNTKDKYDWRTACNLGNIVDILFDRDLRDTVTKSNELYSPVIFEVNI